MPEGTATMQSSLVQALEDLHTRVAAVALGMDERALGWEPAPGMATPHDLLRHAAAEERRWIVEGVAGIPPDAPESFAPLDPIEGQAPDHALFELGSAGQASQMILANLPPGEWGRQRQVASHTTTVAGCVLHVLTELARVLGHLENIAQLWETQVRRSE